MYLNNMTLTQEKCRACQKDSPRLNDSEIAELKSLISNWSIVEKDNILQLERLYKFPDFLTALAFTNQIGEIAEAEGHHPAILTEWGKVTVTWWTHTISGLHRNDFIMAAKTDEIAQS